MAIRHIVDFIVDGEYFVANVDDGRVRVGLIGIMSVDIPAHHPLYNQALEAVDVQDAEDLFDDLIACGSITI